LDEAHSIGAIGKTGRGICELQGVDLHCRLSGTILLKQGRPVKVGLLDVFVGEYTKYIENG
jgi:hypothetical protein